MRRVGWEGGDGSAQRGQSLISTIALLFFLLNLNLINHIWLVKAMVQSPLDLYYESIFVCVWTESKK